MRDYTGVKWGNLTKKEMKRLLESARAVDPETGDDVKEGKCMVDLIFPFSIEGEVRNGKIMIDDESFINNPTDVSIVSSWEFENGIEVSQVEGEYDMPVFKAYDEHISLGTIFPETDDDVEKCIDYLEKGKDPVTFQWEGYLGNILVLKNVK